MPYDSISRLVEDHVAAACGKAPMPLTGTHYDVAVIGPVAVVTMTRTFHNAERSPIEAVLTFPVPVDAVVCGLTLDVDGRTLNAKVQKREQARATYEDALDRGKAAVLHEELLKGLHMVSVGQVGAGATVTVKTRFAMPVSVVDPLSPAMTAMLRIPTTAGQIYGASPVIDSDALVTGGPAQTATVAVRTKHGRPLVHHPIGGTDIVQVDLGRPVTIAIENWRPEPTYGTAADGALAVLTPIPVPPAEGPLSLSLLVDMSYSMAGAIRNAEGPSISKARAVLDAAATVFGSATVKAADRIAVWRFAKTPTQVTAPVAPDLAVAALHGFAAPDGGTEIGLAINAADRGHSESDIILLTDGQSYNIDVQALARRGRRIHAVLIGEEAFEAKVGHLVSLTGGRLFIADDANDIANALRAALRHSRARSPAASTGGQKHDACHRGMAGYDLDIGWTRGQPKLAKQDPDLARAIGAFAAGLKLADLTEAAAADLAAEEGLCCHLTSLVVVDEAGATQEAVPAQRKIALPAPTGVLRASGFTAAPAMMNAPDPFARRGSLSVAAPAVMKGGGPFPEDLPTPPTYQDPGFSPISRGGRRVPKIPGIDDVPQVGDIEFGDPEPPAPGLGRQPVGLPISIDPTEIRIDWDTDTGSLSVGDPGGQAPATRRQFEALCDRIRPLCHLDEVQLRMVAMLLIADAQADHGRRGAGRVARALRRKLPAGVADSVATLLRIGPLKAIGG